MEQIKPDMLVVVEAKDFFAGKKIALTVEYCKDHDDSMICHLVNPTNHVPRVCVSFSKVGDSIVPLSNFGSTIP